MISLQSIEAAAQRIVAAAHAPWKVILFGSQARGEATADSDIDLMVIEDSVPDMREEYRRLRTAIGEIGTGVDLLIYSREEFERRRQWPSSPVHEAVRHGKVLYERRAP